MPAGTPSTPQLNSRKKRNFIDVEVESSSDGETSNMWPRFLVMQGTSLEFPLAKVSPFAIEKGIQGLAGTPVSVKRLRSGDLIIEVSRKSHSDSLLRSGMMANCPIKVQPHRSMNIKKGVIRCYELKHTDEAEILDNLSSQGVTEVRKITIQREGSRINTGTIILTFGLPTLPTSVKCGYMVVKVDTFIPNPLRCFKCQRYGHHRMNCKRDLACARCGVVGHEDKECRCEPHCVNCEGSHGSFSRDCPLWKKEKEIQNVKVTKGISFPEARKIVELASGTATTAISYSDVARVAKTPIGVDATCQTELTWPEGDKNLSMIPASMSRQSKPKRQTVSTTTMLPSILFQRDGAAFVDANAAKLPTSPKKVPKTKEAPVSVRQRPGPKSSRKDIPDGKGAVGKTTVPTKTDNSKKKKKVTDRIKKGEKDLSPNKFNVLNDILDESSMDYSNLDVPDDNGPSGTPPE